MNKILDYNVTGQHIELSSAAMLVAGTVNEYTARFAFSSDWDGYQRVAVFNADGTEREQLLTDDVCKVPWEVLLPGAYLKVGVYGTRDGSRLPTIWTTHRQYIHDGAGPTDEAADPSPVLAEQILQRMGNLSDLKTEDKSSLVAAINEVQETGGGGTADHAKLKNRDAADQHPMSAITGLADALAGKQATGDYLTKELDPTVPEWAKQPQKPAYTAQEVGALPATTHIPSTAEDVNAEPSGAVSQHNVSDAAHSDIRLLIQGLSERLSSVADSDDTTLDQLSEIVAYIKSNKSLIDAITTSKVNVADIVDNLTTNVANKPLSAAQGVALKAIIDALTIPTALSDLTDDTTHRVVTDAEKAVWNAKSNFTGSYNDLTDKPTIPEAYTLPIASPTVLGGVQPVAKTDAMTQSVGVDDAGALWVKESSGGSSESLVLLNHITLDSEVWFSITEDLDNNAIEESRVLLVAKVAAYTANRDIGLRIRNSGGSWVTTAGWGLKTGTSGYYYFHEITASGEFAIDRYSAGTGIGSTTNNNFYNYAVQFSGKIYGVCNSQASLPAGSEIWLYALR